MKGLILMKLYTYSYNGCTYVGKGENGYIFPFTGISEMYELIGQELDKLPCGEAVPMSDVELLSPIIAPKNDVICLGINYVEHGKEAARYNKEAFLRERPHAIYFSKRVNCAVSPTGNIEGHFDITNKLDYECELAFIISKDAKNVKKEDAYDYVFGYTIVNDVSARDLQTNHKQWYFGKSLDGFTPIGPCILTADETEFPPKLDIKSYVNGELRQNSNTEYMVFDIPHIISELSQGMTLKAGTIIATGTPSGVGMGFDPPKFLNAGDEVICEIEKIGRIVNKVI